MTMLMGVSNFSDDYDALFQWIVVVGVACALLLWEKVSTEPQSQDGKNSGFTEVSSVRGVSEVLCRLR